MVWHTVHRRESVEISWKLILNRIVTPRNWIKSNCEIHTFTDTKQERLIQICASVCAGWAASEYEKLVFYLKYILMFTLMFHLKSWMILWVFFPTEASTKRGVYLLPWNDLKRYDIMKTRIWSKHLFELPSASVQETLSPESTFQKQFQSTFAQKSSR